MNILSPVSLAIVQEHEERTGSNARLHRYGLSDCCPTNEFLNYRAVLHAADLGRYFLLGEFAKHTRGATAHLQDVLPSMAKNDRVKPFIVGGVDLRNRSDLAVVLITADVERGPLVAIDGNHRSIAQFFMHQSVEDLPAFVCVHPKIGEWGYVPRKARAWTSVAPERVE